MRVDVEKFLFFGPNSSKESFFREAQHLGVVHFMGLKGDKKLELSDDAADTFKAIKILRGQQPVAQKKHVPQDESKENVLIVLDLVEQIQKLHQEEVDLEHELNFIRPLGNFSVEDLRAIEKATGLSVQIFCTRKQIQIQLPEVLSAIKVGESEDLDYYLVFSTKPITNFKWLELELKESPDQMKRRLDHIKARKHALDVQLASKAAYYDAFHLLSNEQLNQDSLQHAEHHVEEVVDNHLFAVMGWVPVTKKVELKKLCDSQGIWLKPIAKEDNETTPTYLENEGMGRVGEDLVNIYDTPSHEDSDPSIWVLGAFALFFAIIVGDAGYGFLYLLLAVFLWYRYPDLQGMKKRVLKLFTLLSCMCVFWGIISNAYFGIKIDIDSPLRKVSLIQWMAEKKADYLLNVKDANYQEWVQKYPQIQSATDGHSFLALAKDGDSYPILDKFSDQIMLELALFIGVLHILISLLRYSGRNPPNIGWAFVLVGAYLYIPDHLNAVSLIHYVFGISHKEGALWGVQFMEWGLAIAVILALIKHKWKGLLEVANSIQLLSDSLSYLRLYALGLAGAIMAATINDALAGVPTIIAIIVMIPAHGVNMLLGVMGGVIHGLRLNFLEWYHYSFEGGGKPFRPLKLIQKDK